MPIANVNLMGQIGGTGDSRALYLKAFSGETITLYDEVVKFAPTVRKKTLKKGQRSIQFPIIGSGAADYYVPGTNLLTENGPNGTAHAQRFKQSERLISLDGLMLAACFIDDFEETMSSFEGRSEYSRQLAVALANAKDKQVISTVLKGAKTAIYTDNAATSGAANATLLTELGILNLDSYDQRRMRGSIIMNTDSVTANAGTAVVRLTAANILDSIYKCAEVFDLKNVPKEGRYMMLTPYMFWRAVREQGLGSSVIHKDVGGMGTLNPRTPMVEIAGIMCMADNFAMYGASLDATVPLFGRNKLFRFQDRSPGLLDDTNMAKPSGWVGYGPNSGAAEAENDYRIETAATTATAENLGSTAATTVKDYGLQMLAWQTDAVGLIEGKSVTTESQYIIEYQGDLVVVKQAMGADVLRPECCIAVVQNRTRYALGFDNNASIIGSAWGPADGVHVFSI